jgi:hypothetical protein
MHLKRLAIYHLPKILELMLGLILAFIGDKFKLYIKNFMNVIRYNMVGQQLHCQVALHPTK